MIVATAANGTDLMCAANRGTGVAALYISNNSNIPAIYTSACESSWISQELGHWYGKWARGLSENVFEMQIQKPILADWRLGPSKVDENEWLEWDATFEAPQIKPSGTLSVTLKYVGEILPSPITDPWD